MTVLFLVASVIGLLLAVRVMFFGIERPTSAESVDGQGTVPRVRFSDAALSAFAMVFGVVGYLLLRNGVAGGLALSVGAVAGIVAAALSAWGASAWARVLPEHDVEDPRYILQGHLARVTAPIGSGSDGEIVFEIGDERRTVRARLIDDSSVAVGAEVVIERIDDDVAYVESWQQVEKRL